jgi:putative hydrolase of the HAD superfamily
VKPAAIFFDLDDTLLDDTGAQVAYLSELFSGWRARLPHADAAGFIAAWRAALERHFERHLRGELSFAEQRRERMREVFKAPLATTSATPARASSSTPTRRAGGCSTTWYPRSMLWRTGPSA